MTEIVKYFVSEIGNWVFERKEERNSRYKIGNDVRAMDVPVYPSLVYLYPVWVKYRLIRCLVSLPFPLHILLVHLSYDGRFII